MSAQLSLLAAAAPQVMGAEFSPCGAYRYRLWRRWTEGPSVAWCMLNPSTADETTDDPTIRRCIRFAQRWGFAGVTIVNLFALRSTDPKALYSHAAPVGPTNDDAILEAARASELFVAAWGMHGALLKRDHAVVELLAGTALHCLGTTKDGHPRHPLYVRGDTPAVPYTGRP